MLRGKKPTLRGGGEVRPRKTFVYLKLASNFGPIPKISFFPPKKIFGRWGGVLARAPNNTPPPPGLVVVSTSQPGVFVMTDTGH